MTTRYLALALVVSHGYDQGLSPYRRSRHPTRSRRVVPCKVTQQVMALSVSSPLRLRVHINHHRRGLSCRIRGHLGVQTGGRIHFRCLDRPRVMRVNLWKLKPKQRLLEDSVLGGDLLGTKEM